jgi:hypothetical protein
MVKICTASFMETRQRVNLLRVCHREKEGRADVVSIQGVLFFFDFIQKRLQADAVPCPLFVR